MVALTILGTLILIVSFMIPRSFSEQIKGALVVKNIVRVLSGIAIVCGLVFGGFQYAEPGYIYHVRTIFGTETVKSTTGWYFAGWKEPVRWPLEMTVSFDVVNETAEVYDKEAGGRPSAAHPPYTVTMADNVQGNVTAVVRFGLPVDETQFLDMARRYRSPGRLVTAGLKPAVQQAFDTVASMTTAEDYFTSGRTLMKSRFTDVLEKGVPNTKRTQKWVTVGDVDSPGATGTNQPNNNRTGANRKLLYVLEEKKDSNGIVVRNKQRFHEAGILVREAILTQFDPDKEFVQRISDRREAAAQVAIAKEQRRREEEQRLLEIARGEKNVAIKQAEAKEKQITRETQAETERKLVVIKAEQEKQKAEIAEQTAKILLEKAKVDAEAVKVTADAEAYKKKEILSADNALAQKLDAYVETQKFWADAFSKRRVPQQVFGQNGQNASGGDNDVQTFMNLMTMRAAKDLSVDVDINRPTEKKQDRITTQ